VIASDHPAWHINLKAIPEATVEVKGQTHKVVGRNAEYDEAQQLWGKFVAQSPAFKNFVGHDNHQLVVLEPANQA
jgi:hypothetical protein